MAKEELFNLNEAIMAWHYDLTGEDALFPDEAFYDLVDFTDFLLERLDKLEWKVECLESALAEKEDGDDD